VDPDCDIPHSTQFRAAADFSLRTVTASAESVDGSTPGARVTWSTTVPPECVASVTVEFRTVISGSVVTAYTTNDTSETEVIQTGLQCFAIHYISVEITGALSLGTLENNEVQVLVGGKLNSMFILFCDQIEWLQLCHGNMTKLMCGKKKYCAQQQLNGSWCLTHDLCAIFTGFTAR